MDRPLSLSAFLSLLQERLEAIPAERLRSALLTHAKGLPSGERAAFLAIFPGLPCEVPAAGPVSAGDDAGTAGAVSDDTLLADIASFVTDLERGAYYDGYGWDDEIRHKRSWGDESWVEVMDDLFIRANAVFLGGDLDLARQAYQELFRAFALDQEVGTFCGRYPATEMVRTDLREAAARYLRCIYHTAPPDQMPADLRDAWIDDLAYAPLAPTSIDEVRQTLPDDLPGLDGFWPRWIIELKWVEGDPSMRALLVEAVQRTAGLDGLAALAREPGDRQAEHYLTWVDALTQEGRTAEAVAAAREALAQLGAPGESRAALAERLADLIDTVGEGPDAVLNARRQAWRAAPSSLRLRALCEAAEDPDPVLATEIAQVEDGQQHGVSARLRTELLLLAGQVDQAITLLDSEDYDHPSIVLVPYLLVAGSAAARQPGWPSSLLARLFDGIDTRFETPRTPPVRLPELLLARMARVTAEATGEARGNWLAYARREVEGRVHGIVGGKYQAQYGTAAQLAVCCAEALIWAGGDGAGFLRALWAAYPRHRAFKDQLKQAVAASPLMTERTGGVL